MSLFKWFNNGQPKCTEYKSQETNKRASVDKTHNVHDADVKIPFEGLEREMYAINLNGQLQKGKFNEQANKRTSEPANERTNRLRVVATLKLHSYELLARIIRTREQKPKANEE